MLAATPSQNQKGKAKTKSPPASRAEVFLDFLGACGLSVDTPHSPPRLGIRIERKLRSSGHVPVTVKAFISGFKSFIDASALSNDDSDGADSFSEHLQYHARMSRATNLKFLLMNFRLNNDDHGNKHKDSSKLNENVPLLILHQLRFLDHVHDPKFLTAKLVELLEATNSDVTIQKEVIEFIPEVIPDSGVLQIVDALITCMSTNSKTAVAVLDTLGTIGVPDKELPRIIDTVLEMLKNAEIETLPIVIRFLLQTATPATVNELIPRIRDSIDLDAIAASLNLGGSDATLIFDAMRTGICRQKFVLDSWLKAINDIRESETHLPIDLIVLILLRQESQVQKKIDLVMRNKVKNSIFGPALIESTFDTFLNGLQGHFPTVIAICESLVREGAVYHKVASQMYVSAFPNFDTQSQQQLVGCLIAHIGSGVMYEVDCALAIMLKISESHPDDMLKFRIFVKGLVDYLDQLNVAQIRIVYEIFATLALSVSRFIIIRAEGGCQKPFETTDETESEITFESDLLNDMRIIIRKQLGSPDLKFKQMGVLGAVSLIKRLGAASETSDQESASSSSISSSRRADGDHGCVMALNFQCVCLLLDELTSIMSASKMHPKFIVWISESFQSVFIDYFLLNAKNFDNFERCEVIPTVKNEIWFDIKDPDEVVAETVTSDVVEATVNDDMESNQVEAANEISCVNVFPLSGWFYSSKKHRCAMDDDNEDPGDLYHEKQILMLLPSSFKFMQVVEFQTTHSLAELGQTLNMGLVMFDPAQIDVCNEYMRIFIEENAFSKCGKVCLQRIMHILEMQRLFDRLVIVAPKWAPIGFFRDGEDGGDDFSDVRIPFVWVHSTEAVQNEAQESDDNDPMPTGETSATASRKSTKGRKGKQKAKVPARFSSFEDLRHLLRELQLDVFNLLTCEYLKMGVSSDGDQDDICIKMLFLFSELYFKLELTVSGVSNNKLKRKKEGLLGSGSVGSNSLGRVPKKDLMLLILKLGPSLCAGLELAYNEMRKGLEELEQSDTFIPKPKEYIENLWQIYDVVVKCFTLLFQWQDFKSDKYFKIFLKSLAARINPEPEVSPSQSIEAIHAKFVLDCHEYFIAFKHFCPSLSSAILLMKLLLALHECCSDENIANQMRLQMSELAKENLECQWQDEKPKNEAVLFLLQTQVENSPNPFEVVSEYIQSAFKGFIEQDAAVCEKYPMLNKSTFPIFFK
ncbi:Fanconi anemia group D2 protein, partial [Entophlyctis luteolus]